MLLEIAREIRYGARQIRSAPRFAATVIFILALGIGANSAIFSAVDAAFFRPLPFPHAERLVVLRRVVLPDSFDPAAPAQPNGAGEFSDLRADSAVFAEVAAYAGGGLNLDGGAQPERVAVAYVTSRFFAVLQRGPVYGRLPVAEEYAKGGPHAVVISFALWRRAFGGGDRVVGHTVSLNSRQYRIVGVMPDGFGFPGRADVWIPLALPYGFDIMDAFRNYLPSVAIARLAPGITVAQAAGRLNAIDRRYSSGGASHTSTAKRVEPLQSALVGDRGPGLVFLAGSAALLLLIACANVANLFLSRATVRRREIAIRVVLGATRTRILRQLVVETFLLAAAGAVIGIGVARLALVGLESALPPSLAQVTSPRVDERVLLFTLLVAILTSVVVGLAPALGVPPALGEAMKGGATERRRRGLTARSTLVLAEVSLAAMLLIVAGLMLESLSALLRTKSGMQTEHVVTGRLVFSGARYASPSRVAAFYDDVLSRLHAPGIASAAAVSALPMEGVVGIGLQVVPEDAPTDTTRATYGLALSASPGYFATMGVLLRGSDLPRVADTTRRVAVINESMARKMWPGQDAIGRRFLLGKRRRTVIGVVADVRTSRLDREAEGQMYVPISEAPEAYGSFVVRGNLEEAVLLGRLADAVRSVDPREPLYALQPMGAVVAATVAPRRTNTVLLTLFGALAVVLASVGVFAVLSYDVAQRTREIGVRIALGAERKTVIGFIVHQGFVLCSVGAMVGTIAALALSGLLSSLLYGVSARDPVVFAAAPGMLLLVGTLSTLGPALRATRVDPLTALREE